MELGLAADLAEDEAGRGVLVAVEVRQVDFEVGAARAVWVVGVAPGSDLAATAERGQQLELGAAAGEQPGPGGGAEVPGLAHDVARVAEVGDGDDVAAYRGANWRHGAADPGVPGDDVHGDLRALADRLRAAVDDLGRQALGRALPGSLGRSARHDEVHRGASAGGRG